MRFTFAREAGFLRVKVSDRKTENDVLEFYRAVATESGRAGLNRILIESDEITPPPLNGLYLAASELEDQFVGCKVAGVYSSEYVFKLRWQFAEYITNSRGITNKMFLDRSDAIRWLLSP